ncbi:MAG: helix-turn-helix domain-containing protein [bacterium]|nr:helix-turn-helix domain-containing protein [bacterium]
MPSLGEQFRAAREARGVTLSEVAERIHIRSVYLQAIEEEDWPSIGAAVYVRGFLRTYARFLGLDPEGAVTEFSDLTGIMPPATALEQSGAPARSGPSIWVWLAGIVAVALLAIVGYSFWQLELPAGSAAGVGAAGAAASPAATLAGGPSPRAAASAPPSPTPAPQATAPLPPALAPSGLESVTLTWTAPSWVRVIVDGRQVSEGTFPASTVRTYRGGSISLRIGNAGGVEIKENGRDLGMLGHSGDVMDRLFSTAPNSTLEHDGTRNHG